MRSFISCRASHRYLNASFLNTCFFNVCDADPQLQQLLRVVQFVAEVPDVELVHPRHVDRQPVLPRRRDRPQHLLHRVLHRVAVRPQHLLRDGEIPLLAEPDALMPSASRPLAWFIR